MKQEYLVKKINESGCNYDNIQCSTYKLAVANTKKGDLMLVCKAGSVYYGDNFKGWTVNPSDIIRTVER